MANTFNTIYVLKKGWEGFKSNAFILISLIILAVATGTIFSEIINILSVRLPSLALTLLIIIGASLISSYFIMSFIKASLIAIEGKKVSFNVLKLNIKLLFKFLLVGIILFIILFFSLLLLIFPFFLAAAAFFPVLYITVEKPELNIIDIFKESIEIIKKDFGACFLFVLVVLFIFPLIIFGIPYFLIGSIALTQISGLSLASATYSFMIIGIINQLISATYYMIIFIASAEAYKKLSGDDGNITVEAFASNETNNLKTIETSTEENSADTVKVDTVKEY